MWRAAGLRLLYRDITERDLAPVIDRGSC